MQFYRTLDGIPNIRDQKVDLVSLLKSYLKRISEKQDLYTLVEGFPDEALSSTCIIQVLNYSLKKH